MDILIALIFLVAPLLPWLIIGFVVGAVFKAIVKNGVQAAQEATENDD